MPYTSWSGVTTTTTMGSSQVLWTPSHLVASHLLQSSSSRFCGQLLTAGECFPQDMEKHAVGTKVTERESREQALFEGVGWELHPRDSRRTAACHGHARTKNIICVFVLQD